jgi:glycosyltransferase involved in cell wall biosynthesis
MADVIHSMDVGIVPLKKLDLFLGAIPSKIFEILSLKKPLLLGINGEAKTLFIEEGKAGWAFEPEDHLALAQQVRKIVASPKILVENGENGYHYVREHFDRNNIAQAFWQFLQQ